MRERKRIIEKQKTVLISRNFECSILLIIREIQFKTTKHYFTCLRLTKKKKKGQSYQVLAKRQRNGESINCYEHFGKPYDDIW